MLTPSQLPLQLGKSSFTMTGSWQGAKSSPVQSSWTPETNPCRCSPAWTRSDELLMSAACDSSEPVPDYQATEAPPLSTCQHQRSYASLLALRSSAGSAGRELIPSGWFRRLFTPPCTLGRWFGCVSPSYLAERLVYLHLYLLGSSSKAIWYPLTACLSAWWTQVSPWVNYALQC